MDICRFAPTTSGRAHPGTLVSGLLAWLDARRRGGRILLRMEDIDPSGVTETHRRNLWADLVWFGLEWDDVVWQSRCRPVHEAALDLLAEKGRLYACHCSRTMVRAAGLPSVAGGWVYPGTCRHRRIADWRTSVENLRCDLSGTVVDLKDESGLDLSQDIGRAMGDPLVRRSDGSVTYQLAVVADDGAAGVTRVVRGRDIAPSSATQAALHALLGQSIPTYRHHFLVLEKEDRKFAKFHGALGTDVLSRHYSPSELVGFLAWCMGLRPEPEPCRASDLAADFSWDRVERRDRVLSWDGRRLHLEPEASQKGN